MINKLKNIFIIDFIHSMGDVSEIKTIHNCLICYSKIYVNEILIKKWQVINPFNDVIIININKKDIKIRYRFFPWISIRIQIDGIQQSQKYFIKNTFLLYLYGMPYLLLILILYHFLH